MNASAACMFAAGAHNGLTWWGDIPPIGISSCIGGPMWKDVVKQLVGDALDGMEDGAGGAMRIAVDVRPTEVIVTAVVNHVPALMVEVTR